MALKFAEVPGGGSFAPGAGPSWFEMANRQIASLWTGEVSLVLTGVLAALAAFVLIQAQIRGAGGRRSRRKLEDVPRNGPVSMAELRHARMPLGERPGDRAGA